MFDPLLEELNTSLQVHGGEQSDLPDIFKEQISKNGKSVIKSWLWSVPGFRRWRVTRLDAGNHLQVLNSVAYPTFNHDQPILGIDLLWFGMKKKLVAVLDFQPLIQDQTYFDKYFNGLKLIKKSYPEFNADKNIDLYDPKKYFSPWVLFCKGGLEQAEDILPKVFTSFLTSYLSLYDAKKSTNSILGSKEVELLQAAYDKYSAERDPAHGLFSGFFGRNWSEKFLQDFLFPLSKDG